MLAGITDEVAAVGQDLVAVGRAGLGPNAVLAVGRELRDDLAVRDEAIAFVIEDDALAIVGHFEQLGDFDFARIGQTARQSKKVSENQDSHAAPPG